MALGTNSIFYYGHEVTLDNYSINFNEGAGELQATLVTGFYSLQEFVTEVQRALNDAGTLTYTVTVDRDTRIITIEATANFSLLFSSGTQASISVHELLGFAQSDFSGTDTYTGTLVSGLEYRTQFWPQDYVIADNNVKLIDAVVNKSADGRVQIIRFGSESIFEMNLKFITNLPMDGHVILNNSSGVEDARAFLTYIINKVNIEFMPDVDDRATYYTVLLESTTEDKKGTGFKLKEMTGSNVPNVYETGLLKFRKIVI